ncbi:MAG: SGNH/GDSL hydrolase family protein [Kiritimatiellia bacterium]
MKIRLSRSTVSFLLVLAMGGGLAGCGGGGGGLSNDNPGNNDLNVVVAFGDSITQGRQCPCTPYPARVQSIIGKTVYNTGIGGSDATANIGRTQSAIDKYHPAFMVILYGVNDVIHGHNAGDIVSALNQMVSICKANNVVPVLMTYPIPISGHALFAGGTMALNANIRSIADMEGIECVDLEAEFMNSDGTLTDSALYESDGLHPNDAGTEIIALAVADLF